MGVFRPCPGCAAKDEEIRRLREDAARREKAATDERERILTASAAERKDLTLKVTALADVRAASIASGRDARERTPAKPSDLRVPIFANSLEGGGHVALDKIRERLGQQPPKGEIPPLVEQ